MIARVYETVLYAEEVAETAAFYAGTLGLRLVEEPDELGASFRLDDGAMFLVFNPRLASESGRRVPSHGASGAGHVAFSVEPGSIDDWAERLSEHGVELEQTVDWAGRGRSLYVRDPAGNSVELIEGDVWPA